jgi:hypothetical protein
MARRLRGRVFVSHEANITQEHYCQVVMTSVEPRGDSTYHHNRVDLYEYTHHSHAIHVRPRSLPTRLGSFALIVSPSRK